MSAEIVEASFEIAHMIAKEKSHNIGETLIKLCMLKAAGLVLEKKIHQEDGKDFTLEFYKTPISLLDSTSKKPCKKTFKSQVLQKSRSHFFSIQFGETTTIAQFLQLLVNVCFN